MAIKMAFQESSPGIVPGSSSGIPNVEFDETDPLNQESVQMPTMEKKKGLTDRLVKLRSEITVEPMAAFFIMPVMLANMATQNLNLEKACRVNLNFSLEVCDALERRDSEHYKSYEAEVQRLIASVGAWKSIIQTLIPCLLILFVGAWSDKTGRRKICIIMPIFGELLTCISNIVNTYFFYQLPLEFLAFTEAIFPAMTGGWCTMFLGVFSYIGDISSPEMRTFRMGMVNFCMSVGFPIGMGLSGVLLNKLGFYGVFAIAACIHCMSLTYGIFVLKDPKKPTPQEVTGKVKFFDFKHVRDTVGVVCSGPPGRKRRICMLLGMVCMLFGPMYGEITILYLSTIYRFSWSAVDFSIFLTYSFITHTVGTVFSIVVLSRNLKWHDSVLGIISSTSKVAGAFVLAFANNGTTFYFGPMVEILNGTGMLALRSIMSKIVADEQGKINSVVGLAETMMPMVYAPLYTRIYSLTFEVFPGAVFLLSAILTVIPAVGFVYLFAEHRISLKRPRNSKIIPADSEMTPPLLLAPKDNSQELNTQNNANGV